MGRWLDRLRGDVKNRETHQSGTDKTDRTSPEGVSSVLSVPSGRVSEFYFVPWHLREAFEAGQFDDALLQEAYEERAAILEFDEGLPRDEAERLARDQVFGWRQ